jgi:hypothetical protein
MSQVIIKKDGVSYTRHVKDGRIRSIACKHGIKCDKCFINYPNFKVVAEEK